jgi:hypothetical protein
VSAAAAVLALAMIGMSQGCACATYWETMPEVRATSVVATGFDAPGAIVMRLRFADGTEGLYRYSITGRRTIHDFEACENVGAAVLVDTNTVHVPSSGPGSADSKWRFTPGTSIEVTISDRDIWFTSLNVHEEREGGACPKNGVDWSKGGAYAGIAFIFIPVAIDIVTSPIQLAFFAYLKASGPSAE